MSVIHIESVAQFEAIVKDTTYVAVDFSATWCGPCKAIAPMYEKLAVQYAKEGVLAFVKVDVDDLPDIASKYEVRAMPTFIFFAHGELSTDVPKVIGTNPAQLTARIASLNTLATAA